MRVYADFADHATLAQVLAVVARARNDLDTAIAAAPDLDQHRRTRKCRRIRCPRNSPTLGRSGWGCSSPCAPFASCNRAKRCGVRARRPTCRLTQRSVVGRRSPRIQQVPHVRLAQTLRHDSARLLGRLRGRALPATQTRTVAEATRETKAAMAGRFVSCLPLRRTSRIRRTTARDHPNGRWNAACRIGASWSDCSAG